MGAHVLVGLCLCTSRTCPSTGLANNYYTNSFASYPQHYSSAIKEIYTICAMDLS
jgi:hypothetical protein